MNAMRLKNTSADATFQLRAAWGRFCGVVSLGLLVMAILACSASSAEASSAKILKVLPQYLDKEGRHALSPSLYERDAYQYYLRMHPRERSAMRFYINWKARGTGKLLLRIELRGSGEDISKAPLILERPVRPSRFFSTWSSLVLEGDEYQHFGQLLAWRATLWDGESLLAEQKSFLW
jgi:hypothetical protein